MHACDCLPPRPREAPRSPARLPATGCYLDSNEFEVNKMSVSQTHSHISGAQQPQVARGFQRVQL